MRSWQVGDLFITVMCDCRYWQAVEALLERSARCAWRGWVLRWHSVVTCVPSVPSQWHSAQSAGHFWPQWRRRHQLHHSMSWSRPLLSKNDTILSPVVPAGHWRQSRLIYTVDRPLCKLPYILAYKSQNLRQNLDLKVRGRLIREYIRYLIMQARSSFIRQLYFDVVYRNSYGCLVV